MELTNISIQNLRDRYSRLERLLGTAMSTEEYTKLYSQWQACRDEIKRRPLK